MTRPRLTIALMLAIIAGVGVVLAAVRSASDAAVTLVLNGVVLVLIYALVEARFSEKDESGWWFGFAVFGWTHLLLSSTFNHLGTDWLLSLAWDAGYPQSDIRDRAATELYFKRYLIFRILSSLLVAPVGGWLIGWWVDRRRRRADSR